MWYLSSIKSTRSRFLWFEHAQKNFCIRKVLLEILRMTHKKWRFDKLTTPYVLEHIPDGSRLLVTSTQAREQIKPLLEELVQGKG